jgi:hypothetical protein
VQDESTMAGLPSPTGGGAKFVLFLCYVLSDRAFASTRRQDPADEYLPRAPYWWRVLQRALVIAIMQCVSHKNSG